MVVKIALVGLGYIERQFEDERALHDLHDGLGARHLGRVAHDLHAFVKVIDCDRKSLLYVAVIGGLENGDP